MGGSGGLQNATKPISLYLDINDEDPSTYKDVMVYTDKEKWHKAINQEMESMYFNSVYKLIDFPVEFRPIGNKWIYKRKNGPNR